MEFAPTNSFCYNFARYRAHPEILQSSEVLSGQPFRLIELTKIVVDRHLTKEQQSATFLRAESGKPATIMKSIKWYVPFIAKNKEMLTSLGNGVFKKPSDDGADLEEAELESEEYAEESDPELADLGGTLYAYSFPTLIQTGIPFPIKIGLASGDAEKRVQDQCRQAASFESPKILKTWPAKRIRFLEIAVHNTLRARGRWREDAPGREWFDSTLDEVDAIVQFIEQS